MKRRMTLLITTLLTATMLLSVVPVVNATDTNEAETKPTTVVEPVNVKPTTITLKENSKTLYIKGKYTIKPTVKNGVGKTTYKSSNKKIATVTNVGVVTAKKKGKATISVVNNGVVAKLKIVVKKPSLNITKTTIAKGKSFKIKIKGVVGKATFKSSKSSVAKVDKNGKVTAKKKGKAAIIIKTNGNVKLKCNVTVKNPTKWDLVKYKVTFKRLKDSLTVNLGEPSRSLVDYFNAEYEDNISSLYLKNKITYKQFKSYTKKLNNKVKKTVTYSIEDSEIGKLSRTKSKLNNWYSDGLKITAKGKGTTNILIKYGNKTLKIKYTVTKKDEFTYKGKKAKAVYTVKEASDLLVSEYYDRLVEGKEKKYDYIFFYMSSSKSDEAINSAVKAAKSKDKYLLSYVDYEHPLNCWDGGYYCCENEKYYSEDKYSSIKDKVYVDALKTTVDIQECKDIIAERKNVYLETNKIFEDYNINSYETDYEKILALSKWFDEVCVYDDTNISKYGRDSALILEHRGVCGNYARATKYFCYRLNIPCYYISSEYKDYSKNHGWNVVKIQGKWYHLDLLWHLYFLGSENIKTKSSHTNFKYINEYLSDEVKEKINIQKEDFVVPKNNEP